MAITLTHCQAVGRSVACVTDFEGNVERVICPHYDEASRTCSLRADALRGGLLSQLLEGVADDTLTSRGTRCALV